VRPVTWEGTATKRCAFRSASTEEIARHRRSVRARKDSRGDTAKAVSERRRVKITIDTIYSDFLGYFDRGLATELDDVREGFVERRLLGAVVDAAVVVLLLFVSELRDDFE
jgi:hypothetical protein